MAATRKQVLDAIKARLAAINGAGAFTTTAGARVTLGSRHLTEQDVLPALRLVPGDTRAFADDERSLANYRVRLPITIEGIALAGSPDQLAPAEALLADAKLAVFLPNDRTLGGLVNDVFYLGGEGVEERPEGSGHVGCHLPLEVDFMELYGGAA